jgi:hypothetical protein
MLFSSSLLIYGTFKVNNFLKINEDIIPLTLNVQDKRRAEFGRLSALG